MVNRVSWNDYFLNIAKVVSTRSTCARKAVGAVIVRDRTVLATGYNGSLRKADHCTDIGCLMEDNHCVRTIHAEANAIVQAAKNGVKIDGSLIYITASPCFSCFKLIVNSGIHTIAYDEFYRDQKIFDFAKELHIDLIHLQSKSVDTVPEIKNELMVNSTDQDQNQLMTFEQSIDKKIIGKTSKEAYHLLKNFCVHNNLFFNVETNKAEMNLAAMVLDPDRVNVFLENDIVVSIFRG